jgi:hypothetical protein
MGTTCDLSYAFSGTGALEGLNYVANKNLVSLSEQFIFDCHIHDTYSGCCWETINFVFSSIAATGIPSEEAYPFTGLAD